MSIVTRTGDSGRTRLLYGEAASKADLRIEAGGAMDELNAFLGWARVHCSDEATVAALEQLQRHCFVVGAELATPPSRRDRLRDAVDAAMTALLEQQIAEIEALPGILGDWALPGATLAGAALDVARTVARRAERCVVRLNEAEELGNPEVLRYLNRLSDLLWLLGRRQEIQQQASGALRPDRARRP